jgi:hypothetical protein
VGEVFLPKGHRTKEGDGEWLPQEYQPEPADPSFLEALDLLAGHSGEFSGDAGGPIHSILSRRRNGGFVGDFANDLWKLEQAPRPWSNNEKAVESIHRLFSLYREQGFSVKTAGSFEPVQDGDQLIVAGCQELKVRGRFSCLTLENTERPSSHIPSVMRLRYLKDSSGGCNFDFDPFRRLPLTWYLNLPGETGDGLNFANSHVVNIAKETSPAHFHPPKPIGVGTPQHEVYLVLDPKTYSLNTYGRKASMIAFPHLPDLNRFEEKPLQPGSLVSIPPGTGHRGLDVFVNVITLPGFKPHNEYYLDGEILEKTDGSVPCNRDLAGLRNYEDIAALL